MAQFHCRWRNVLICVCSPCICLALLFIYATIMVCIRMGSTASSWAAEKNHFVASGTFTNNSFAPLPKTFWEFHLHGDAFWNNLQQVTDRHFNPILHPNDHKRGLGKSTSDESPLRQSFSAVINLDSTKRNFEKLPQQIQEFVSHMQKRDYPTITQPDGVCGAGAKDEKEPPLLLLAIKTTELNFKNRQAIRQTWGQVGWVAGQKTNSSRGEEGGGYVRRVFLLGKENTEELGVDLSDLVQLESKRYGDIIQWDFKDTFYNLTLKDVLFWSWFSRSCGRTRFVFKGDDDVFVNTPKMITYLQEQLKKPKAYKTMKDFMVGDVIGAAMPNRVNKSKYFVPDSFYKGFYPTYAGGGGVVYSGQLTKRLHNMSKKVHLFPIDDVYVGMCMIRLKVHPVHHPAFLTFDFPGKEEQELCSYHRILLVHKRSPHQVVKLWDHMNKTQTQCWDVPLKTVGESKNKPKTL
ncbi:N-acetyllactosaminide beta-1,3-N-acetylglucosaminyltransferase 2-like [Seriola lalandi dorsalis]|uniref:Hexosyltransferase n=1 Tax=Seriola lalandi dorsalis TaxID=1841481 RepID=A0A3B4Z3Z6_SERLL|nr:N-acetyllactosaminide beta-1,3-N-acetylglucosaminyltransferase 2-like [Seriola lalandi dorsalis]XP_056239218.1 N-acetyllactosaminide beta-1,3-N-acetylglucosaminyltransferase 2-like [Seriola aureovittata]